MRLDLNRDDGRRFGARIRVLAQGELDLGAVERTRQLLELDTVGLPQGSEIAHELVPEHSPQALEKLLPAECMALAWRLEAKASVGRRKVALALQLRHGRGEPRLDPTSWPLSLEDTRKKRLPLWLSELVDNFYSEVGYMRMRADYGHDDLVGKLCTEHELLRVAPLADESKDTRPLRLVVEDVDAGDLAQLSTSSGSVGARDILQDNFCPYPIRARSERKRAGGSASGHVVHLSLGTSGMVASCAKSSVRYVFPRLSTQSEVAGRLWLAANHLTL